VSTWKFSSDLKNTSLKRHRYCVALHSCKKSRFTLGCRLTRCAVGLQAALWGYRLRYRSRGLGFQVYGFRLTRFATDLHTTLQVYTLHYKRTHLTGLHTSLQAYTLRCKRTHFATGLNVTLQACTLRYMSMGFGLFASLQVYAICLK
jgi:hypothetical protein